MPLDSREIRDIQEKLEEINRATTDYDIYRDFIKKCKNSVIPIPDKIKAFIIADLEEQQK